jgi:hypothetical protein
MVRMCRRYSPKTKQPLRPDESHQPLPVGRLGDGQGGWNPTGSRKDAYESNHARPCPINCKWALRFQPDKVAGVAESNFGFEGQLPAQCRPKLYSRYRFAHDKGTGSTHIHDVILAQLSGEDAGAKPPVSTDVHPAEENHEWSWPLRCAQGDGPLTSYLSPLTPLHRSLRRSP